MTQDHEEGEVVEDYTAVILPDGDAQVFVFPEGVRKFCKEHDAEALHILDDIISFYSRKEKKWISLDDDLARSGKITAFRGKTPNTPEE